MRYSFMQAETANVAIPELDFELHCGVLSGRFTTIEGLLSNAMTELEAANPFGSGDSAANIKLKDFLCKLNEVGK